jgi:hypothetical protein
MLAAHDRQVVAALDHVIAVLTAARRGRAEPSESETSTALDHS